MPFFQADRYCVPRSPASRKWFWHPRWLDAARAVSEVSIGLIRGTQPDGSHPASAPGKKPLHRVEILRGRTQERQPHGQQVFHAGAQFRQRRRRHWARTIAIGAKQQQVSAEIRSSRWRPTAAVWTAPVAAATSPCPGRIHRHSHPPDRNNRCRGWHERVSSPIGRSPQTRSVTPTGTRRRL